MSFCIFRSIVKVVYHLFGVSILKKCYPHLNQANNSSKRVLKLDHQVFWARGLV